MKKTIALLLVFCSFLSLYAQEYSSKPYFATEELPDLIKCLPAPPEKGSAAFKFDVQRYKWGKQQRKDAARAEIAKRDAVWTYEALVAEFWAPFGTTVNSSTTPAIWTLLDRSLRTVDQIRVAPKAFYHRTRPFEYFGEKTLTGEDDEIRGEGSYPSGHTIRSWLVAMLLSEINPDAANAIYERAWTYGESRVIAGAHWQSDVDASRVAASIGYSRLQTSEEFRSQLDAAKEEFRRLQPGREAFVSIAEVIPDVILEIRYFSTYNFVGSRVDSYLMPIALMTRQATDSLKAANEDFKRLGYRIKIYDAYRPQAAVNHFVRWAEDQSDTLLKAAFYPEVDKAVLFDEGYIARKSGHSRGSTIDLTLVDTKTGKEIDMGGTFDWFGIESHPDFCGNPETGHYTGGSSPAGRSISQEQFANRMLLRKVMLSHGFKPLDSEWWHFTLNNEPFPNNYFNFPVSE
ncbi:MAG: phosphatase PAP2 family protein [Bacteroidales bacterium]|nr:phosphatase PAP2 family protein [Bacteroidales bacterium]